MFLKILNIALENRATVWSKLLPAIPTVDEVAGEQRPRRPCLHLGDLSIKTADRFRGVLHYSGSVSLMMLGTKKTGGIGMYFSASVGCLADPGL